MVQSYDLRRREPADVEILPGEGLRPREVRLTPRRLDRFREVVDPERVTALEERVRGIAARTAGRSIWNVNSTPRGGGVAEMLRPLVGYARGEGIDCRWMVIEGTPEFFGVTKRLHHMLHGSPPPGGPPGERERAIYEAVLDDNLAELRAVVRPGDVAILHDPQTAGLVPGLKRAGARVVWRSHIGQDRGGEHGRRGWEFLERYLVDADATVFSRQAYVPECCDTGRSTIIQPSIDPFSAKNQDLTEDCVRAILVRAGIVEGPPGPAAPTFLREDGSPARVDRAADIVRLGRAPTAATPLVVQVSRWDPLKDHIGVMDAFARLDANRHAAHLVLAGPCVTAVADDPEAPTVMTDVLTAWRRLPHEIRRRVQLVSLPMTDPEENAAIVNALQRHATIVVQKSLREGFGLTVTEAMWKARPVVASAVGGIQDQIVDGETGVLLDDPSDFDALAAILSALLADPDRRARLGSAAHARVRDSFLGIRDLEDWATLIERLFENAGSTRAAAEVIRNPDA